MPCHSFAVLPSSKDAICLSLYHFDRLAPIHAVLTFIQSWYWARETRRATNRIAHFEREGILGGGEEPGDHSSPWWIGADHYTSVGSTWSCLQHCVAGGWRIDQSGWPPCDLNFGGAESKEVRSWSGYRENSTLSIQCLYVTSAQLWQSSVERRQ